MRHASLRLAAILFLALTALPLQAQPSKAEAARGLEARVLAENLQDFAQRSGSARAYLMAAELRLLYPNSGDPGKADVHGLLRQALSLAPNEPAVKAWAGQLDRMARPTRPENRKSPSGNR